ncbi:hypothetical protein [Paracoccus sp. SCSIO 75233]|uniref:hypothetical protein n=1 Tax=Paracoccus sp. SCSIO 75233 TaxID=3017782 RepID=UPI0022F02A82|nr:hypothetical protein [Paracoccus sp. SCSIO 75233]WBU53334.1 hypothetical protein PAF12_00385 [Paracoccus sp. SCSIO 75233]
MMELMREIEEQPESWPEITDGLLIPDMPHSRAEYDAGLPWVWQRIEAYCCDRWTPRSVVWMVQGSGEWQMPLRPAVVVSVHGWTGSDWSEADYKVTPWGGLYLNHDANRITATVGADNAPPPAVTKAVTRLANYLSQQVNRNDPDLWATSMNWTRVADEDGEQTNEGYTRKADYIAKALQYSGAADLLRPYRRVK